MLPLLAVAAAGFGPESCTDGDNVATAKLAGRAMPASAIVACATAERTPYEPLRPAVWANPPQDHGSFNSWDRQPFFSLSPDGKGTYVPAYREITRNFWINDYNSQVKRQRALC